MAIESPSTSSAPLGKPVEIVGHPVIHVWLQSAEEDIDVFAYIKEIDPQGQSHYITEGCLRTSLRALAKAPYANMGLPYHPCLQQAAKKLPTEPVELVFDLLPTAKHFPAGHRIRVAIACADKDNCQTPKQDPAPRVTLLRDAEHPSHIVLPIVSN